MLDIINGKKVLVVEDEEHNYLLLREFLDLYGIETIWVETGMDALNVLKSKHNIALVMLDMKLPVKSGYQIAPEIKALYPGLPVIAQTAHAQPEDEEKCYASGCDAYISKPFTLDEMTDVINKAMEKMTCLN